MSARLSAIEAYNKPRMTYRDEITVITIVNAWELALKATFRTASQSIFYPKQRNQRCYHHRFRQRGLGELTPIAFEMIQPAAHAG